MARLRPTSRLNKVDLPTFGRPTIAMVGVCKGAAGSLTLDTGWFNGQLTCSCAEEGVGSSASLACFNCTRWLSSLCSRPLSGQRSAQHGQCPDPLLSGRVDRIAQGGRQRRNRRLSYPGGYFRARNPVRLDHRSLVHADGLVVVEIPLHDTPFVDRDLRPQSIGQRINHRALDLLLENIWIDHLA